MNRLPLLVVLAALVTGIALGVWAATWLDDPNALPTPQSLQLSADDQNDYLLNVADAYAADANLQLARDRLARLNDPQIASRVQEFAINYAPKRTQTSLNLIRLAVALGSKNGGLIAMLITPSPTALPTQTLENAPVFSNVRATPAPTKPATATPKVIGTAAYVVVPNDHPFIILPTNTPTITPTPRPVTRTPTRRPNTRVPTAVPTDAPTETPTDVPPPPAPFFEPDRSRWPGTVYFEPANVPPGQGYWHLSHAIYCDAFDSSDDNKYNFGCDERPGGGAGTSIYVMAGGSQIDVWAGGENVADNPAIVGDKKNPGDMCDCDYAFESSNVKVNVRGAPSDAIGGFCLCGVNFGWGSRAHVRFFLYFEYITR